MGKTFSKNKVDIVSLYNADNIDISNVSDVCVICLNEVKKTSNNTTILECNHSYHTECIDIWLSAKNICPYCMQTTNYKPNSKESKKESESETEIVINIIQNNVQNIINKKKKNYFNAHCIHKETCFILLGMFVFIINIMNIALLIATSNYINNNYIGNSTNISDISYTNDTNNTDDCFETSQEEIYVNITIDYIIQGIFTIYIYFLIGMHTVKNKYIYMIFTFSSYFISYGLNLYRYFSFNKYFNEMKDINYCNNNIFHTIEVYKIITTVEIIILGVFTYIYILFNVKEYFHRRKINN